MSEIRTFKCDICKEGKEQGVLYSLALNLTGPFKVGVGQYRRSLGSNKHICPICMERLGIVLPTDSNLQTEDQLLDILRDFINETTEDN